MSTTTDRSSGHERRNDIRTDCAGARLEWVERTQTERTDAFLFKCRHFVCVGKDIFSPEVDSSPAPSSAEPQNVIQSGKQTSRTSSFEIENLLKTAEQVNRIEFWLLLLLLFIIRIWTTSRGGQRQVKVDLIENMSKLCAAFSLDTYIVPIQPVHFNHESNFPFRTKRLPDFVARHRKQENRVPLVQSHLRCRMWCSRHPDNLPMQKNCAKSYRNW